MESRGHPRFREASTNTNTDGPRKAPLPKSTVDGIKQVEQCENDGVRYKSATSPSISTVPRM